MSAFFYQVIIVVQHAVLVVMYRVYLAVVTVMSVVMSITIILAISWSQSMQTPTGGLGAGLNIQWTTSAGVTVHAGPVAGFSVSSKVGGVKTRVLEKAN